LEDGEHDLYNDRGIEGRENVQKDCIVKL